MDLKEMRKQFNDILSSILSTKRADNNAFLTAAEYNMRIAEVKSSKTILLTPKVKKSVKDYRLVRKYDVTTIEGEDRLIKPIGNDLLSPVLHYVMNEELFDILHSTHTAMNHAGRNRMVTELKARYYNITKETIMAYLRLCEFCQRKLVNKKKELDPVVCQKQNSGKLLNELEAKGTPLCIMGKLNNKSGVEIIPINETSTGSSRSGEQVGGCLLNSSSANMQRVPYMSDPTIVPRVQKYLESNVDKTYVDINVMADELQRNYREYAKRKRSAFRASVKKAYAIVLQSYGLQDQGSSDDDEVSDSEPEEDSRHFISDNSMHNTLMDLYKGPTLPKQILDENELIDISSDESEEANYGNRASNGPSTSQPQYNPGPKKEQDKRYQAQNVERAKKRKIDSLGSGPISKSTPKKKKTAAVTQTNVVATFKDIGGMDKVLEEICKLLVHIKHPEIYKQIGISPPRGFLLHGPPGCGKTLLANAIAGELNVAMIKVAAPELVAGVSGESEERIRDLFERAVVQSPCVLFIDEIDAITPHRQNVQKEMERRIVAQLLSCLDDLTQKESGDRVLVIGATNRPDAIDPALRRAGRFDREISVGIPDVEARRHILQVLTSQLQLAEDFDFISLAKYTPGFVGADLLSLTREAAMNAVNRKFNDLKETRKIEEAMALQKALEESKKKPVAKPVEDDEVKEITSDSNKSDPEIIVDDDVSKDAPTASDSVNGTTPSAVVVIEDDQAKQTPETDVQIVNGEPKEEQEKLEQMPVDVSKPNISPLEELLAWLHDTSPISPEQLSSIFITMEDFGAALKRVQPSAKREGFATVPDTTWSDVGSLRDVREELQMAILAPVRHAEQFKALGLNVPTGVFLCGPPGCGKTLLAKAIANEAGINFISVKGPELLNMYVGESERAVRVCFERARNSAPCVIFFDELDALCPKRSDSRDGGPTMRVVNQMLTEMDGVEGRQGVFLLAASNRPDIIDPAVLRPGRLDKIIFVGLPTAVDRVDILRTITKDGTQPRLSPDVDLDSIGSSEQCRGYTGADLAALVREAAIVALKEVMILGDLQQPLMVNTEHFKRAVAKIRPSVSEKDQKHYEKLRKMYSAVPEIEVEEMEYS